MASATAMKKHVGGVAEYRASEGKTVEVGSSPFCILAGRQMLNRL